DTSSTDTNKHLIPIGKARIVKSGGDITLVAWGNTVSLCQQVADSLETVGIEAEIIDLRTIKPFDLTSIIASVEKTQHLIVTHEDNITCGVGGEIIASVVERANGNIKARRVARPDTYTPCNYTNQLDVLPSYEKILTAAAELLNLSLSWQVESALDESVHRVAVIGASPSDESVLITSIRVKVGDEVKPSDTLVDIEASKAAGEILSPCHGYIEEIQVTEGERAMVGEALLTIRLAQGQSRLLQKQTKKAILKRSIAPQRPLLNQQSISQILPVGICRPHFKTGSRQVSNSELLQEFTSYSHADIVKRTGIENRYWLAEDESIVDIAVEVIIAALKAEQLKLADINVIICATCTPEQYQSPAMACLILAKLYSVYGEQAIPAYDINAACSGYLYALQNAKDYLQTRPNERVLVVTAEALSRRMNLSDFDTAFLFGDAATATVVCGRDFIQQSYAVLDQVYLSAIGESGEVLNIPVAETEGIVLQGKKLFTLAVKTMAMVMHKCCQKEGIELTSINLVV
ncbi:MAG: transketolase C-terminal domain-containing protein, partial [Burkholderiales bacterium]